MTLVGYLMVVIGGLLALYSLYWGILLVTGGASIRRMKSAGGLKTRTDLQSMNPSAKELPFVSVVVAAKNEGKVIGRLIRSLQRLRYDGNRIEFIISESGSSDNTSEIVRRYAKSDPRIKLVTSEKPGKGNALNAAIKIARGDVFFFLDADCVPEADYLMKAIPEIVNGNDLLVGYYRTINSGQSIWTKLATFEDFLWRVMGAGKARLNLSVPLSGPSTVMSRRALESVHGGFKNILTEDIELWVRLLKAGYAGRYVDAYVWMEAPARLEVLLRQRIRWYRGYLETALMHLDIWKYTSPSRALDAMLMLSTPFFAMLSLLSYGLSLLSIPVLPSNLAVILFAGWFIGSNIIGLFLLNLGIIMIVGQEGASMARMSPLVYLYTAVLSLSSSIAILNLAFSRPRRWIKTERTGYVDPAVLEVRS
ncbi:MAG: glycosyltransferase family 2 protein [Nitrososphaerota archaeon]|jgi:cellulose synthase/poly-beta-1,6-N-acetylglucosamine synthase-like glycosyltransferase|nr:glycosyltransferase family 2 protein [Nitrososphaerota archaeon]